MVPVPPLSAGEPYAELFRWLLARSILALGSAAGLNKTIGIGTAGNRMPYVFTTPPHEAAVH